MCHLRECRDQLDGWQTGLDEEGGWPTKRKPKHESDFMQIMRLAYR